MDPKSFEIHMPPRVVAAFAVHVFTACGAACALLALIAAVNTEWTRMFLWLGLALIIDGLDGTFSSACSAVPIDHLRRFGDYL